jgi:cytidine deaminase
LLGGYALLALKSAQNAYNDLAISYRDFKVGAAAAAFNPVANRMDLVTGFNFKVDDTDLVNTHAEDIVIKKLERGGSYVVALLVVVGDVQPDQTSGLATATLHPCGKCRKMLSETPLISPDTIFMSATSDLGVVEVYDLDGLKNSHNNGDHSAINTVKLRPLNTDNPEDMAWYEDWDDHVVKSLLLPKCAELDRRQFLVNT